MDIKASIRKIFTILKKYRYAVAVLAIGLILMSIPGTKEGYENSEAASVSVPSTPTLEDKLTEILSQVSGAGNVRVILTIAEGEDFVYQTNDDTSYTNDTSSKNTDTVTITDAQHNQSGLIRQINPAVYQGAVVVCQGADNPSVRLALVDAVSKLTGLGANCISVLKMK